MTWLYWLYWLIIDFIEWLLTDWMTIKWTIDLTCYWMTINWLSIICLDDYWLDFIDYYLLTWLYIIEWLFRWLLTWLVVIDFIIEWLLTLTEWLSIINCLNSQTINLLNLVKSSHHWTCPKHHCHLTNLTNPIYPKLN